MIVMSRGLYGQKYSGYWNGNVDFFNTATYIGIESTFASIDFPQSSVEDNFSWKWYGFITPSVSGTYTFGVTSDNRSKVYIDGTEITTADYLDGTVTGTYVLNSGQRYLIQIYYGEGAGGERIIFYWSGGSQTSLTTDLTTDVLKFYPNNLLPINNNLVGWYKGEAWNGTSWPDLSGNGNHCTDIRGTINKAGNYIYGGVNDGIRFPIGILPSTYTLFHVARYNGSSKGRIFDGVSGVNWLSGFHGGKTGVTYHGDSYGGWLTESSSTNFPLDQILISSDQKRLYRGNGVDLTINNYSVGSADRLSINYGSTSEYSDWAVWEVIVYNRELSLDEIETVEGYLFKTHYTYTNPVVPRGVNYFNPRDIVFYKKQGQSVFVNQMTANTTIILGLGEVVASASSEHSPGRSPWTAFNGTFGGDEGWHSLNSTYNTDGSYPGSNNISGYKGEWLKIKFDIPLFLNYSVMYARTGYNHRLPKIGYLLASNDNTNWSVIQYVNRSVQVSSFVLLDKYVQRPFQYYAIVVSSIFPDSNLPSTNISEWYMDVKIPKFQVSEALYPIDYIFYNGLQAYLNATRSESYPGSGTTWYDISGKGNHFTINQDAYKGTYMDFQGSYGIAKRVINGALTDVGPYPEATIVCVCELLEAAPTWRTLVRGASADHQVIVKQSDSQMGMYDNNGAGFLSSGFDIRNLPPGYNVLVWKLSQSSPYYQFTYNDTGVYYNITNTNATFTNGFCCVGGYHNVNIDVNVSSQYFGKIKVFMFYDRFLNTSEIRSLYNRFRV